MGEGHPEDLPRVCVTVTPSGWSNDDAGPRWLRQVLGTNIQESAWRKWGLVVVDRHRHSFPEVLLSLRDPVGYGFPPQYAYFAAIRRRSVQTFIVRLLCSAHYQGSWKQRTTSCQERRLLPLSWQSWLSSITADHIGNALLQGGGSSARGQRSARRCHV